MRLKENSNLVKIVIINLFRPRISLYFCFSLSHKIDILQLSERYDRIFYTAMF